MERASGFGRRYARGGRHENTLAGWKRGCAGRGAGGHLGCRRTPYEPAAPRPRVHGVPDPHARLERPVTMRPRTLKLIAVGYTMKTLLHGSARLGVPGRITRPA